MQIILVPEPTITQYKRSSVQILDILATIGGVFYVLFIFCKFFNKMVVYQHYQANIAQSYYLK